MTCILQKWIFLFFLVHGSLTMWFLVFVSAHLSVINWKLCEWIFNFTFRQLPSHGNRTTGRVIVCSFAMLLFFHSQFAVNHYLDWTIYIYIFFLKLTTEKVSLSLAPCLSPSLSLLNSLCFLGCSCLKICLWVEAYKVWMGNPDHTSF